MWNAFEWIKHKNFFSVLSIGKIKINENFIEKIDKSFKRIIKSNLLVPYLVIENRIKEEIEIAKNNGESLGGSGVIVVKNFPPGIGDYNDYLNNLDGLISQVVMSVPSVKAVEIGDGIIGSSFYGSEFHDEFYKLNERVKRKTNRCGGIEGGVSNGEDIVIKFYAKPIPTLLKGLNSIDFDNFEEKKSQYVRSDIVAIPAITIVVASRVSIVLANELKKQFGGDTVLDLKRNFKNYLKSRRKFWQK